jgi:Fur family transcriptional regulator, ferric uptake regulator
MSEIHAIARRQMDAAGHVYTRGRQLLIDTLASIGGPVTIPAILAEAPGIVQSSLYRNLAVLQEAGLVTRVDVGEGRSYFELSELVTEEHHHHLVCRECATVIDVSLPSRDERAIERILGNAAHGAGFELTEHRVDLVGVCAACRAGSEDRPQAPAVNGRRTP